MFDIEEVRSRFPALQRRLGGVPAAYLDGPGGSQAPRSVMEAMAGYLRAGNSNLGGPFAASREADQVVAEARRAVADLWNVPTEGVVFGQNMTSLTFAFSRALARTWTSGDEIVVTDLDHDANITPWEMAAADVGATVHRVPINPRTGRLEVGRLGDLLSSRTRLVAITHASNALGTIPDVASVVSRAHAVGALTYVDAVHAVPHLAIDVGALDADFVAASAYKFFGPHVGMVAAKPEVLAGYQPYKVAPAPDQGPGRWETGTQSFEALAGLTAAVDHIASLGTGATRRHRILDGYRAIGEHERSLSARFLAGAREIPDLVVHGVDELDERTPTFAVALDGERPSETAARMGDEGVFVWAGHYYAVRVMEALEKPEGLVRIGFAHYNTSGEVDRVLSLLDS